MSLDRTYAGALGRGLRRIRRHLPWLPGEPLEATLDRARRAWLRRMKPAMTKGRLVILPDYPILPSDRMRNCRVLPLREDILRLLPKKAVGAEIGVQAGDFSQAILEICAPTRLDLVDIDLSTHRVADRFRPEIDAGRVHVHEADSAATLASFPDAYFDFVYVDGDHSYEGVKRDIAAAHSKVKPDGWLLFNDYTFWSSAECMPYGVMHAVNEFCLEHDWDLAGFAFNYLGYADVALRRRGAAAGQ